MLTVLSKLIGNSPRSISNWKKEGRLIIELLEKYFTKEELLEFLQTGKINKLENIGTTTAVSVINFVNKVAYLYTEKQNSELFYDFLIYYTQLEECFYEMDSDYYWYGLTEIDEFQEVFFKYLIESSVSISDLRHMSSFINRLGYSDLLFLNMEIENGWSTLFNFKHTEVSFYSSVTKSSILDELKHGLQNSYRKELGGDSKDKDLAYVINMIIEEARQKLISIEKNISD